MLIISFLETLTALVCTIVAIIIIGYFTSKSITQPLNDLSTLTMSMLQLREDHNYLYSAAEHPKIDDPHAAKSISSIMRTVSATAQPSQTMNSGVLRTPSQANGYSSHL